MLSRLSRTASRLLDVHWSDFDDCDEDALSCEGDDITFERAFSRLSNHVPDASLGHVVGYCGKLLNPVCQYVGAALSSDVDCLVRTMQDAELRAGPGLAQEVNDEDDDEPIYLIPPHPRNLSLSPPTSEPPTTKPEKVPETPPATPSSSSSHEPIAPPPTIPKIIITPAPLHPHDLSSLVPIQNAAFGSRLTVPSHISFNAAFPPMARPSLSFPNAAVNRWTFENGHWCANIPKILDQERLGLFSRPVGARRRAKACGRNRKSRMMCDVGVFARPRRDP